MTNALLPPSMLTAINTRLTAVCEEHRVIIPLAIESGSRAWGFPSLDSDYDCRFVFIRPLNEYLSPWQRRDVIETPLEGDFDVNGWDLSKAIRLLANGNAVIIEWLTSPMTYQVDVRFREEFLALAHRIADRTLVARHYLHLGERYRDECFAAIGAPISRKKLLYALRPAAALRWLRLHEQAVVPMHFPPMLAACDPPDGLSEIVAGFIERKAQAGEKESEPIPAIVAAFIKSELAIAREVFQKRPATFDANRRAEAETFFRNSVQRLYGEE